MSKTLPEIAKALIERRNRMSHVIIPGEINAVIGADGLREALNHRWLVADVEDSGYLKVTNDLGVVAEMQKLAEVKPEEYSPEAIPVSEGHDLSLLHTRRRSIQEIAAPMTGHPSPGLSTVGQPQPPMPAAPPQATGQAGGYSVGTPVTVARQGRSASGVIEKMLPDGRFQVGFADTAQKLSGDNIFSKEEFSPVPTSPQAQTTTPSRP